MSSSTVDHEPTEHTFSETARRFPRWVVAVGIVALLTLTASIAFWRNSATPFEANAREATHGFSVAAVGEPLHVPLHFYVPDDVTIRSIEGVLADDSVQAATAISVCDDTRGGASFLSHRGDLAEHCGSLAPAAGTRLGSLPDQSFLVLSIVPLEAGEVVVRGVDVAFDEGWRRGRQHTGPTVEATVQPS